jgi:phosphonate transport system substrate-binding protein
MLYLIILQKIYFYFTFVCYSYVARKKQTESWDLSMKKGRLLTAVLGVFLLLAGVLTGCSSNSSASQKAGSKDNKEITMVFYPNESAKNFTASRKALQEELHKATGKKINIQTTTDYNVAIAAIASGKAQLAFMGADGYIQAHAQNKKVVPLLLQSGPDGTTKGASYRSYLMVQKDKADQYKKDGKYNIDKIKGEKISFVSASSTSGFAVPTDEIAKHFKLKNKDELSEGGKFFSKVLYGTTHPGSAINLLKGDADVAAFDDGDLTPFLKVTEGSYDKVGSTFTVRDDADAPFAEFKGKQLVNLSVLPVQNGPFVVNSGALSKKDIDAITKRFTTKEFTETKGLFSDGKGKTPTLWQKKSDKTILLKVDDDWYKPTHELVGK